MVKDWSPDFTLFASTKALDDAGVKRPGDSTPLSYQELHDVAAKVNKKAGAKRTYWGFVHSNNDQWMGRTAMNMLAEKGQALYSADFAAANITGNSEAGKGFKYFYNLAPAGPQQRP